MCSSDRFWVVVSVVLSASVVFPGASPPPNVIPKRLLKNAIPSSADSLTAAISASSLISSCVSSLGELITGGPVLLQEDTNRIEHDYDEGMGFALYRFVGMCHRFRETYCLHLQGFSQSKNLHVTEAQNIIILATVRTSNLTWHSVLFHEI